MKKLLFTLPLVGALCAPAFGQQAPIPSNLPWQPRSDYGCEVLLCLANPQGPTAAPLCRPPIERLWRDLHRGRPFPTCKMASGPTGQSYATPGYNLYDACPSGTSELPAGQTVMLAAPMSAVAVPAAYRSGVATTYSQASTGMGYVGIGDGSSQVMGNWDSGPPSAKVCVAGLRGTQLVGYGDSAYEVSLYDTIYMQQAQTTPRFIDVYIDNSVWQRVRW